MEFIYEIAHHFINISRFYPNTNIFNRKIKIKIKSVFLGFISSKE
jgi:hypothetical protein